MPTESTELRRKSESALVRVGPNEYAGDAYTGVVVVLKGLSDALNSRNVKAVKQYLEVINSWQNGNEQERLAYEYFLHKYGKLYRKAEKFVEDIAGLGASV
ncbi:hypothetical protein JCM16161A_01950 [Vulcanisaeta sp. JCM 16161]|uniref:hypothetical protein n=1 Tax=Vulcanisaeta sp. JCM 16161 TaxID=1295372 RepID=UPI000AE76D41|nr:hypothetical protein [Vulcanisaeta sp. JCM 16161]